jgi:hypothetical protein
LTRQTLERIPGLLEFRDPAVQSGHALVGQLAGSGAIVARIQIKQFLDLFEREARGLRLLDEAEAAQVLGTVAADSIVTRWRVEETATLIVAHCFDAHPACCGKLSDAQ